MTMDFEPEIETRPIKMKMSLTVIGIILLLAGLVWGAQGSGYFPYPGESFMIGQTRWVYYGAATAIVGLLVIIFARR